MKRMRFLAVKSGDKLLYKEIGKKTIPTKADLRGALRECVSALKTLASHESGVFSDQAPEFNEGGIGYEAIVKAQKVLQKA